MEQSKNMFKAVSPKVDIQKLERDQLEFWRSRRIFERTMEERAGAPKFVFYEGPPTANGKPGSHHVLARAFKDMFPRYKTMRGFYSLRRGGWDTHGLPVEIEVEKQLGITVKSQIEEYGIAEFNKQCRDSVFRYITDWEKLTERIGFWVSLEDAYVTFTNDYIESVWWILKKLWEKGLLYQGYKVVPYSPTSGTALSSHEVSLGYQDIIDPSVYVRFPLKNKPGVYFLAWTTTPWTLPSNVALAVGENIDYVQVEGRSPDGEGTENLILAAALLDKVLANSADYKVVKRFKGKDLLGEHYNPLYTFLPVEGDYAYLVAGDFVSTEDGTGIVHIAPAFGVDDMAVGEKYKLPTLQAVNETGRFVDAVTKFRGMWFKDADKEIIKDLQDRGLMYKVASYEHSYPHNWRDGSPLMYFARKTWFIRTTALKDRLVALNQTINWVPDHIKDGRFGNWLDDLKDWALGRERYWGTPLPVWVDDQTGETLCVSGVAELSQLTGRDLTDLDLHRPYVDEITFPNPKGTGGTMRRVTEVIDVWFDSGAMPIAQWGYPHRNPEAFAEQFPADYICEAVDQTRGWFYSLHAIAGLVFDSVAYKNVICLGHILDGEGQKMSKSKGNIVNPWEVLDEHGADAFRWYLYTASPPGESRRFSKDLVGEVVKKFWSTLWNTYSFFVTYANLDGWTPDSAAPEVSDRDPLDQWALASLHKLVKQVTDAYDNYDATGATRPVQAFVDELSNWYVRLSRRRFWKGENDAEKQGAYATLYECLVTVAKLIAPTMPFLSDALYRNLVGEVDQSKPESVHLADWPTVNEALLNSAVLDEMGLVQQVVSLGLAARNSAGMRVRQPLSKVEFALREGTSTDVLTKYAELIMTELNVKAVGTTTRETAQAMVSVRYDVKPYQRQLGKKYGKDLPTIQQAFADADQDFVRPHAEAWLRGENAQVQIGEQMFEIAPEDVELKTARVVHEGFGVGEENGVYAVVDTTLTEELVMEGMAREVVRRVQNLRKTADFNVEDKIVAVYTASEKLAQAIERFNDYISAETLAESFTPNGEHGNDFTVEAFEFDGEKLSVGVKRV